MLAATVGVLVLAAALAAAAPDRLALVLARSGGSESARAADELRDALGQEAAPGVVILTPVSYTHLTLPTIYSV